MHESMIVTHQTTAAAARIAVAVVLVATGACAGLGPSSPPKGTAGVTTDSTPKPADIAAYLEVFDRLAPGDPVRQYSVVADLAAQTQAAPTASNRLKYALALGAAGRSESNPIEAKRLISELLAEQNDLQPKEISLAKAYLREFDARVALYADLARQHEESERDKKAADVENDKRVAALGSDNQRLKKALAEAERKLEAVAEMEKALTPREGQQP
jgi:hypothetical protein